MNNKTIRIITTLKEYYMHMFAKNYGAVIVRSFDIKWFGRRRVIMDIPDVEAVKHAVIIFSSCNSYKIVYRYSPELIETSKR